MALFFLCVRFLARIPGTADEREAVGCAGQSNDLVLFLVWLANLLDLPALSPGLGWPNNPPQNRQGPERGHRHIGDRRSRVRAGKITAT
jgi:hypothetical protein